MRVRNLVGLVGRTLAIGVAVLCITAAGRDFVAPVVLLPDHHCPGGNFYCDIECAGVVVTTCKNGICEEHCVGGEHVVHLVFYPGGGGGGGGGGGDGGGPKDGKACFDACWWDYNDIYGCLEDCWDGEN